MDISQKSMQEVGVSHLAQRPIGHLSGGEHRKVQIARALCQQPDLFLQTQKFVILPTVELCPLSYFTTKLL